MADNTAASWLPARGRFSVTMGPSFNRALKLRKNEPPPNSRHERHYHVLRSDGDSAASFKPSTVDITKPGAVEFHKHEETRIVKVERPSTHTNDETHLFNGRDIPTKDIDCILIFDEDTKTFTLEKVDSIMTVTYDKKIQKEQRAAGSPMPSSGPSTSASSPDSAPLAQTAAKKLAVRAAAEHAEAETRGAEPKAQSTPKLPDEGAKKAPPRVDILNKARNLAFTKKVPKKPVPPPPARIAKEEGEASEGEIVESPRIPPEPVRAPAPTIATASQPVKAGPARKTLAQRKAEKAAAAAQAIAPASGPPPPKAHALPPKPLVPSPSPKKTPVATPSNKRSAPEEPPTKPSPPKRAKASPPPSQTLLPAKVQKSIERPKEKEKFKEKEKLREKPKEKEKFELALPGGPGLSLPGALSAAPKSTSLAFPDSGFVSLPPAPPPIHPPATAAADDDSEEEEWDDVLPTAAPAAAPTPAPPPPQLTLAAPPRMITMEEIEPEPTKYEDQEEEEEEIDEYMFAQELDEHLGEDMSKQDDEEDDFLAAAISPVIESQPMPDERRPLSPPGDVGDGDLWGDEDDSSSSDDSDDD
ncbi:hypothetical protein PHLGIDRAFT_11697 [Phlebiopsis gigantea 11061_1 CR5-6]|uniref:Transcription elongation factor Eaf N-terminal domain-containing protein n=1 Tax=Phlebiopsis gigantea (strain 11061_1 CR5-6) TaxID=745531 RepID=A0A0C3SB98_PHLG1|nr:hypothetical protein PHLGIDRAFT_11697 [Phlebiopsis gigantea 11061_1 CR5-6]